MQGAYRGVYAVLLGLSGGAKGLTVGFGRLSFAKCHCEPLMSSVVPSFLRLWGCECHEKASVYRGESAFSLILRVALS